MQLSQLYIVYLSTRLTTLGLPAHPENAWPPAGGGHDVSGASADCGLGLAAVRTARRYGGNRERSRAHSLKSQQRRNRVRPAPPRTVVRWSWEALSTVSSSLR